VSDEVVDESEDAAVSDDDESTDEVTEEVDGSTEVTYELNEWSSEARLMLEQLMLAAGVRRAWIGTDLQVGTEDEERVDEMVEQVRSTDAPMLDPDADKVIYEVGSWDSTDLFELMRILADQGIGYEFDVRGDLVVLATQEEDVDAIVDDLTGDKGGDDEPAEATGYGFDDRDDDEHDGEGEGDEVDGLETAEVLSDLYVAVDRLQKSATDHAGVLGVVQAAGALEGVAVPFGFDTTVWSRIQEQATRLRDDIEGDEATDADITHRAKDLRTLLSNWV
jgi:hypothetical protein